MSTSLIKLMHLFIYVHVIFMMVLFLVLKIAKKMFLMSFSNLPLGFPVTNTIAIVLPPL